MHSQAQLQQAAMAHCHASSRLTSSCRRLPWLCIVELLSLQAAWRYSAEQLAQAGVLPLLHHSCRRPCSRRLSSAAGQGSPNIHADSTNITGTINAFTTPQLDRLRRRVEEVVNASGAMYGAHVSTQWTKQAYVPVRNDAGMLAVVQQAIQGGHQLPEAR